MSEIFPTPCGLRFTVPVPATSLGDLLRIETGPVSVSMCSERVYRCATEVRIVVVA
jgi:hypothetical protein